MIWNKRGYKFLLTVFMDPKYTLDGSYRARISNRFEVVAGQPALEQVCALAFLRLFATDGATIASANAYLRCSAQFFRVLRVLCDRRSLFCE